MIIAEKILQNLLSNSHLALSKLLATASFHAHTLASRFSNFSSQSSWWFRSDSRHKLKKWVVQSALWYSTAVLLYILSDSILPSSWGKILLNKTMHDRTWTVSLRHTAVLLSSISLGRACWVSSPTWLVSTLCLCLGASARLSSALFLVLLTACDSFAGSGCFLVSSACAAAFIYNLGGGVQLSGTTRKLRTQIHAENN